MNDEWIEHDGGACPVGYDERVEVEHRIGIMAAPASILKWENVKRYRIVKESST